MVAEVSGDTSSCINNSSGTKAMTGDGNQTRDQKMNFRETKANAGCVQKNPRRNATLKLIDTWRLNRENHPKQVSASYLVVRRH